ncbi:MAG: phospholipase [Thermoleophilia bacterium]|nr:phospholipase [Thermoleophilia bacterium]
MQPGAPNGPVTERVLDALRARAREGLPVTMQLDALGSRLVFPGRGRSASRKMVADLRAAGVEVLVKPFTLTRARTNEARLSVDHRKIFEIDGRVAWEGGVNLVDSWSPWYDMMLRAEGPVAAQAGAALANRWSELGGTVTDARRALLHRGLDTPASDATSAATQLLNGKRNGRNLTEHFANAAQTAQHRLWIMNPYLGDMRALSDVIGAAKRGVDTRLMLTSKAVSSQQQDVFTDPLRRAFAYELQEAGGQVYKVPGFAHAKAWIADNDAGIGSHNLDRSSTRRSYENAITTNDPSVVGALEAAFAERTAMSIAQQPSAIAGGRILAQVQRRLRLEY